jgi:hypothetical protein
VIVIETSCDKVVKCDGTFTDEIVHQVTGPTKTTICGV